MKPEQTEEFKLLLADLYLYLKKKLKIKTEPKIILVSDQKNADKMLGKTAYYNNDEKTIYLFITERHPKDILRSFAHECVHANDHQKGKLKNINSNNDPQYAQHNEKLRNAEKRAYLLGSMLFRDWDDQKKDKNANKE
jgi:hypothetical protein